MKALKRILGLLLILVSVNIYAQDLAEYYPNPELEDYVGTWQWESGDSVIVVHFEIEKKAYYREFFGPMGEEMDSIKGDFLLGWHKVIKGNSINQNSIAKKDEKSNRFKNSTIQGAYRSALNCVGIKKFTDMNNNTNPAVGRITLLDKNTMSIELSMEPEGLYIAAERAKKHKPKYQLPLKMVLKRVE
jgi:hypothetical protein